MNVLEMSEEEKKQILNQHKEAAKNFFIKKDETKHGLKAPEKKDEEKKSENKGSL